jgi:hypothetical protein
MPHAAGKTLILSVLDYGTTDLLRLARSVGYRIPVIEVP